MTRYNLGPNGQDITVDVLETYKGNGEERYLLEVRHYWSQRLMLYRWVNGKDGNVSFPITWGV